MQTEPIPPLPPLTPREGVLTVDGFGIRVHVRNGRLVIEDGIGRDRRRAELSRATARIHRVVLLGHEGFLTLEALRWIADIGAAVIQIDRDGTLVGAWGPLGYDDPRLRRAQAMARGTPIGEEISRMLLQEKLSGQASLFHRLPGSEDAKRVVAAAIDALEGAATPEEFMVQEAAAAAAYWGAWSGVEVAFIRRDQDRVPEHWRALDRRASARTGNPRLATNPANALVNYLYAILEAECRIACLAVGLDPGLGVLHADQRGRDSMALDLVEAVRPQVDAYLLNLLEGHVFRARDFHETRQGVCRVLAPLTHALTATAPTWRRAVGPVAERVARMLAGGEPGGVSRLTTPISQENRSAGRDRLRRGPRPTRGKAAPAPPRACRSCGATVKDRRRHYCAACLPERRGEATTSYLSSAHAALAKLRAEGRDPGASPAARAKVGRANAARRREEAEWDRTHPERPSAEVFRTEILPGLQGVSLARIARATGLSLAYCGEVRRGEAVPHPRHWEALSRTAAGEKPPGSLLA